MELLKEREVVREGSWQLTTDPLGQLLYCEWKAGVQVKTPAFMRRCFPWSHAQRYFSLMDTQGDELTLIGNPEDLDLASRKAFYLALTEAEFCFRIQRVMSFREEFELRVWEVETQWGQRKFQTRINDWPIQSPKGDLLIVDLHGDLYQVESPKKIWGKEWIAPFVD